MQQYPARVILGRYDHVRRQPFVSWDEKICNTEQEAQDRLTIYREIIEGGGRGPRYEYALVPLPCVEAALEQARRHLEETYGQAGLITCANCTDASCPYSAADKLAAVPGAVDDIFAHLPVDLQAAIVSQ